MGYCFLPKNSINNSYQWKKLAEYNKAGNYTFTIPNNITELGLFILGAGGSGGIGKGYRVSTEVFGNLDYHGCATGGGSGQLIQAIINKDLFSTYFSTDLQTVAITIGAGGKEGSSGGQSSCGSLIAVGGNSGNHQTGTMSVTSLNYARGSEGYGQPSDYYMTNSGTINTGSTAPYGNGFFLKAIEENISDSAYVVQYLSHIAKNEIVSSPSDIFILTDQHFLNIFDLTDKHIYCGAGGCAASGVTQSVVQREKGGAGVGYYINNLTKNETYRGYSATAPGDGGGAIACEYDLSRTSTVTLIPGAGADGLVMIYGR